MIDPKLMAEAAEACAVVPADEQLKSIAFLAKKQQRLEREVSAAEKELYNLRNDLAKVSELEIPDALAAVGLAEFTLEDGYKVSVSEEVYANIPSADTDNVVLFERREACFAWLRGSGNEALIKQQIKVEAGRGEDALAQKAEQVLAEAGIGFTRTESVHSSTLRAFVREQVLEKQTPDFPKETFGVHVKKVATIKAPKAKKGSK